MTNFIKTKSRVSVLTVTVDVTGKNSRMCNISLNNVWPCLVFGAAQFVCSSVAATPEGTAKCLSSMRSLCVIAFLG